MPGKARKEEALKKFHWLLIPSVFIVDRLLKIWMSKIFSETQSVPVFPGLVHLTRVNNTGAAFGLWRNAPYALAAFSAVSVLLIIAYLAGRFGPRPPLPSPACPAGSRQAGVGRQVPCAVPWALVAGGALGNLYDRLRFGYVVDYLDLRVWPVFNFADACISVGAVWILICFLKSFRNDPRASDPS